MNRYHYSKKNVKKLCIVMVLLCAMLFSVACSGEEKGDEPEATEEAEHEISVGVENGTIKDDSVVIAVGQTAVTYNEYKSYYFFMKRQYDSLLSEEVWKQRASDDQTIGQVAIKDVVRLIIQVKVIGKEAMHEGVSLEADEKENADYNAQKLCESLGDDVMKEEGLSTPLMMTIFEENKLADKMYRVVTGRVDVDMTDEQKNAYRVLLFHKKAGDDKEALRQEMETIQKQVASSNKSFYLYAKQKSDDPEVEAVVGGGDERKNLVAVLKDIGLEKVSPVIEESDGFYLAYLLEKPNRELNLAYQNELIENKQIQEFQDMYSKWVSNYDVEVSESLLSD